MVSPGTRSNTIISETSAPSVTIIILNWNGWKDTVECLESLFKIKYPRYDVIVVDNASSDESIRKIKEYSMGNIRIKSKFFKYDSTNKPITIFEYDEEDSQAYHFSNNNLIELSPNRKIILIKNKKNYGFSEGNNIAIRFALKKINSDYILLLNNDVVVNKNFLSELVKSAESSLNIGIVGPKIYYYDFKGRNDVINFAGEDLILWKGKGIRYGFREVENGKYNEIKFVDKIEASCMMVKKEVFNSIGLLDIDYFFTWEDTDFSFKAKKNGFQLLYIPTSIIWHKEFSSTGLFHPIRSYYYIRNRLIFIGKNTKRIDRMKFLLYFLFYDIWKEMGSYILYKDAISLFSFIKGVIDGFKILISI